MNTIDKQIRDAADQAIMQFCVPPEVGNKNALFVGRAQTMARRVLASRTEYQNFVAEGHNHETALDMSMTYDMYKEITWRLGCNLSIVTAKAVDALLKYNGEIVKCTVEGYRKDAPDDKRVPREDRGLIVPEHPKCANITRRQLTSASIDVLISALPEEVRTKAAQHGLLEVAAVIYFILNNNVVSYVHISEDRVLPTDTMPDESLLWSRHDLHGIKSFVLDLPRSFDTSKKPELKAAVVSFKKEHPDGDAAKFLSEHILK